MTGYSSLGAVRRELESAIAELRSSVARVRAQAEPTHQEREAFVRAALSGALGADMRELGRRLDAGEVAWSEVLGGTAPDSHLLGEYVGRMLDQYGGFRESRAAGESGEVT
jgi:hypothetical protein